MKRRLVPIAAGVILLLAVGGWVYLTQVAIPRSMAETGKAISAALDSVVALGGRLAPPEDLPSGSRILLDQKRVGVVTALFRVNRDTARHFVTSLRISSPLQLLGRPDSATIYGGRLTDRRAADAIRAHPRYIAWLSPNTRLGGPVTIWLFPSDSVVSTSLAGYLWLPADTLLIPIVGRGGA